MLNCNYVNHKKYTNNINAFVSVWHKKATTEKAITYKR